MPEIGPGSMVETSFEQYALRSLLGEGGAGRVWLATDSRGADVALKVLASERATRERRKRFKNEILFSEKAHHPNIVPVLDHGVVASQTGPSPFYVMPVLETSGNRFESSDANQRLLYFDQVLSGVEAAHLQDVVHRDLKPENILYDRSHDSMVVADFGIAHFADDSLYTVVGTAANERLGSFLYAAPEQRVRGQATDARTDIYSLGLILNRLFTSEVPGGADYKTVGSVYPELGWVDDLVVEMIQQDPERRLPSIDVVKTRMVAMRQDYVVRQRLSQIRDAVVPVGEEDDPLALEPPRFVDWDWENGRLTLVLSRPVNPDWVAALRSSARNAVMGKGPGAFHFNGTKAVVQAREEEVQRVIDYFKEWLSPTTVTYRIQRARQREESAEREKAKLRAEQEELERRRRLRETIRL